MREIGRMSKAKRTYRGLAQLTRMIE